MKNKVKKSVVTAMVLGMTVSGTAGVYAGTNLQKITAYLNHSLGFKINGAAYYPTDANGNKMTPITYHDSTYLPVRALSDALEVPIYFDAKNNQILIGSTTPVTIGLRDVKYSSDQTKAIQQAFASFKGFETAYAPKQMVTSDAYQKAVGTDDGVNLVFKHMIVNISPRDYSDGYTSKAVTLSNGTKAKWYTPGDTPMLGFKLDDRTVTISSPDHALSNAQIEKLAVSVAKLPTAPAASILSDVKYSSDQTKAIQQAFASFKGFETAYAPKQMVTGDAYQKAVGTDDGVNLVFTHMIVNVSPRDYSDGYTSKAVTLSNGTKAKWYTPGDTPMLGFKLDDRTVTISSPDHALSNTQIEKLAVSVAKLTTAPAANNLSDVTYSSDQTKTIQQAFASFKGFETAYAPKQMVTGDAYQKAVGTDDGVNLVFTHMIVNVSPRDYSDGYTSKDVTLSNGIKAKWYTPGDTPMLGFKLDDRTVTISSPDHALSSAQIEKVAVSVAKLK